MMLTGMCAALIALAKIFPYPRWASKVLGRQFIAAFQASHRARVAIMVYGHTLTTKEAANSSTRGRLCCQGRLWKVTKTCHMLIRVFFLEYTPGGEPQCVLSAPMKVAGLSVVLLVQAVVITLFFQVTASDDPAIYSSSNSAIAALIATAAARPCLGLCGRWFRYCAKSSQSCLTKNKALYAASATYVAIEVVELRGAIRVWLDAMNEIRVRKLRALRVQRLPLALLLKEPIRRDSRVYESFVSVTSAITALHDWRDATTMPLRSSSSTALKRARDQAQFNLYKRIVLVELMAAPETLRRNDSDAFARCADAFERIDEQAHGILSTRLIMKKLRRDPETRSLFRLPYRISREDGSWEILEAVMHGLQQNGSGVRPASNSGNSPFPIDCLRPPATCLLQPLNYDGFKHIFTGISAAAAILVLGASPSPDSASAELTKLLGNASEEPESQAGVFGLTPRHQSFNVAGIGLFMPPSFDRQTLRQSRVLSASFLRTPGQRRSDAIRVLQSQAKQADNAPIRAPLSPPPSPPLLTLSDVSPMEPNAVQQDTPVPSPPNDHASARYQGGVSRFAAEPPNKPNIILSGKALKRIPKAGVVRLAKPTAGAARKQPKACSTSRAITGPAPASPEHFPMINGSWNSDNQDPGVSSPDTTHISGSSQVNVARETERGGEGEINVTMREVRVVSADRLMDGKKCCCKPTTYWAVLPWALVGGVILLAAALVSILSNSIHNSYPYVMWPWYNALVFSLGWTTFVQESLIIVALMCRTRRPANAPEL